MDVRKQTKWRTQQQHKEPAISKNVSYNENSEVLNEETCNCR